MKKNGPTHVVVMNGFRMPAFYACAIQERMEQVAEMICGTVQIQMGVKDYPSQILFEADNQITRCQVGDWIIISPTNHLIIADEKQYRTLFQIQKQ